MPRNSEIDRKQIGHEVLSMSQKGLSAAKISTELQGISKQQVDRYLQKNRRVTAAVSPINSKLDLLVAAIQGLPNTRDTQTPGQEYFGRFEINTSNIFDKYYAIARGGMNGQVSRAFINLSLKMTNGITVVGEERAQDSIDEAMTFIDFKTLSQDISRSLCEMGTVIVPMKDSDGNYTVPKIHPINYITLITENETIGSIPTDTLIHGNINRIVHAEEDDGQIIYNREDVALFRFWSGTNYFTDIKGRSTFGLWGESMVPAIETPLKSLMNASYYYDDFIKRYGMGRLHIDMKMLSELYKDDKISKDIADNAQQAEAAAFQDIKANEDIITVGEDVEMIDVQQAFDITKFFEFREKQIDRALLQSDIASGTVASGWTGTGAAVSIQELITLQSLRDTFFHTLKNEVVVPYLEDMNISTDSILIYAEPLSQITVAHRDLLEMAEVGAIAKSELRQRAGFPPELPEDVL